MIDILSLLDQASARYAALPATINEHRLTSFSKLAKGAARMKDQLREKGMFPGHTAVLRIGQSELFPQALLGAWLAGMRVALINPAVPDSIARVLIDQCDAAALITVREKGAVFVLQVEAVPVIKRAADPVTLADSHCWTDPDREALIVFTSGSTGIPKGIVHSWRTLGVLLSHTFDLYPHALDFFSVPLAGLGGVQMLALSLRDGLPLRILNDLSPESIVHAIGKIKPRHILLFPALISAWVTAAADRPSLLASVEACHSGGDKLSLALHHTFKQMSGIAIMHAYGMAECGPILKSDENNPALMQPIAPHSIHLSLCPLQGYEGTERPAGELIVSSPSLMRRYLGEEKALPAGSAFATGELFQSAGQFAFRHIGRVSEGLHGLQIQRVEESVNRRLGVRTQVCAVEDGGVLKIFISGADIRLDGLVEQLRKDSDIDMGAWSDVRLRVLPSMPLGPTGKVDRAVLGKLPT